MAIADTEFEFSKENQIDLEGVPGKSGGRCNDMLKLSGQTRRLKYVAYASRKQLTTPAMSRLFSSVKIGSLELSGRFVPAQVLAGSSLPIETFFAFKTRDFVQITV